MLAIKGEKKIFLESNLEETVISVVQMSSIYCSNHLSSQMVTGKRWIFAVLLTTIVQCPMVMSLLHESWQRTKSWFIWQAGTLSDSTLSIQSSLQKIKIMSSKKQSKSPHRLVLPLHYLCYEITPMPNIYKSLLAMCIIKGIKIRFSL